ncbi:MAG: hypothetical protein II740_09620, partial [Lachnospiraceae bacterium]|nr:hypothetical protein [Lachnospiraceae bacterium]
MICNTCFRHCDIKEGALGFCGARTCKDGKVTAKGITKIVGVESRGFVMAAALAAKMGAGVVLARKPGKLPATVI